MIPKVDGKIHHFRCSGLYNGLAMIGDLETHSFWDHITGECFHGELRGKELEVRGSLIYMTVKHILKVYPDAYIAISHQTLFQKFLSQVFQWTSLRPKGYMPPFFAKTMGKIDDRLPKMDIGLGVSTGEKSVYYPMNEIKSKGNALIDTLNGLKVLVYIDPISKTPAAAITGASSCKWEGDELHLDTQEILKNSRFYDEKDEVVSTNRPLQTFTRWYGFSYTFPNCDIYSG